LTLGVKAQAFVQESKTPGTKLSWRRTLENNSGEKKRTWIYFNAFFLNQEMFLPLYFLPCLHLHTSYNLVGFSVPLVFLR